jgi:hypothetical protein
MSNRHRHLIYELDKKQYMLTDNKNELSHIVAYVYVRYDLRVLNKIESSWSNLYLIYNGKRK